MKKRISTIILFLCLICSSIPVYAEDTTITQDSIDKIATATVTATVGSNFSVTIPKSITLTKDTNTGLHTQEYTITTSGDIAGSEVLTVAPQLTDGKIKLSATGKTDVTATVTQTKTQWLYNEFGETTGTITTDSVLSSGNWSGNLVFNILLDTNI